MLQNKKNGVLTIQDKLELIFKKLEMYNKGYLIILSHNSEATKSHRLKLLVIEKLKGDFFKGTRVENLPVFYFNQKKGCMNQ